MTTKEDIEVLEKMLSRMKDGALGYSGFSITETNTLSKLIKQTKTKK